MTRLKIVNIHQLKKDSVRIDALGPWDNLERVSVKKRGDFFVLEAGVYEVTFDQAAKGTLDPQAFWSLNGVTFPGTLFESTDGSGRSSSLLVSYVMFAEIAAGAEVEIADTYVYEVRKEQNVNAAIVSELLLESEVVETEATTIIDTETKSEEVVEPVVKRGPGRPKKVVANV